MLPIAREFQGIFILGTLALVVMQVWTREYLWLPWASWLLFAFLVRDFNREVPPVPLATISPVDGSVSSIEQSHDPYLERNALCYTLRQAFLGEFNLHSPTEGKVEQLWVQNPDTRRKALAFWVQTDEGDDVVVEVGLNIFQHASTVLHPGERVGQGRRCGFVGPGCKVRIYLPAGVKQVGGLDEKIMAGRNILANYVHS